MPNITIRKENHPTRCEICHQSDCFDQTTNKCSRCENLLIPIEKFVPINNPPVVFLNSSLDFTSLAAASLGILAFIPGLFLPPLGLFLGIIAAILGMNSLKHIKNHSMLSGESLAYIGLYCGSLAIVLEILILLFIVKL
ncbi:MAG: hypothetical protein HY819_13210 [Acidobacteria bacterium]|nr:hypothetical protein [Acidobacteriota bacterium]